MKKLFLPTLAVLALSATTLAQDNNWGISVYKDFRTHETSVVVLRRIGPLEKPFGLNVNFDIDAFAGTNMSGDAVVGAAVSYTFPLARNLDVKLGLGTTWQPGQQFRAAGVGALVGFTYRF